MPLRHCEAARAPGMGDVQIRARTVTPRARITHGSRLTSHEHGVNPGARPHSDPTPFGEAIRRACLVVMGFCRCSRGPTSQIPL
jgi:hypothetical protein